jgi:hypothetical protein
MADAIRIQVDASELHRMLELVRALPQELQDKVQRNCLNRIGDMAYTRVTRQVAKEVGLPVGRTRKYFSKKLAGYRGGDEYQIIAKGQYTDLKDFDARQTKRGVTARAWGKRRLYAGTFFVPTLGNQVFRRIEGEKTARGNPKVRKLFGPAVPNELVRGESEDMIDKLVAEQYPKRLDYELNKALTGMRERYRLHGGPA